MGLQILAVQTSSQYVENGRMDRSIQIQNATWTDLDRLPNLIHFDQWGLEV